MIGSSSGKVTLGGLVIAMALMACDTTSAQAGLATIPAGTQVETKIDWTHQVSLNVESTTTSTTSIDTQSLFASDSATTQSTASIAMIEAKRTPAEAPIPPAAISGSIMLLIGAAAVRSMKRKLAL
jgi:hypothetical protein